MNFVIIMLFFLFCFSQMEKSAETDTEKPEFLQVHAKLLSKTTAK